MRENLDQWDFVIACYVVTIVATFAMIVWCWADMKRAEKRRDEVKRK